MRHDIMPNEGLRRKWWGERLKSLGVEFIKAMSWSSCLAKGRKIGEADTRFFFLFPKVVFLGENSCLIPIILPSSVLGWWVIILIFITAGFDRKWVKRLFTFLYLLAGGPPTVILLLLPPLDPRSTLRVQLLKDLASGVITRKMEKRWLKARLFRHHY